MRFKRSLFVGAIWLLLGNAASALGPIDGEAGLMWWNNDFTLSDSNGDIDAGAIGGHGEIWLADRWGLRGALYRSDLEDVGLNSTDHISIDIKRRLFSPTDNTFFAVGFGWEDIDIEDGSSTNGARFLLEGKIGILGAVSLYGFSAWIPDLDDVGNRSDLDGQEIEAGVVFDPFPFLSLRAGYRRFKLDYTDDLSGFGRSAESKGFLLGAGIHW